MGAAGSSGTFVPGYTALHPSSKFLSPEDRITGFLQNIIINTASYPRRKLFYCNNKSSKPLRNLGNYLSDCTVPHPRRQQSS
jgi:hypothetical protein